MTPPIFRGQARGIFFGYENTIETFLIIGACYFAIGLVTGMKCRSFQPSPIYVGVLTFSPLPLMFQWVNLAILIFLTVGIGGGLGMAIGIHTTR